MSHAVSRRSFLGLAGRSLAGAALTRFLPLSLPLSVPRNTDSLTIYIGTYTSKGKSKGIYRCRFNSLDGSIEQAEEAFEIVNPSFLTIDRKRRRLYAVSEVPSFDGHSGGGVTSFSMDGESGDLRRINSGASGGPDPCHISLAPGGNHVLVANYTGGSIALIPVDQSGRLLPPSVIARHEGAGPVKGRQESPHAHSVIVGPGGRYVYAADLGIDRIVTYRFDAAASTLVMADALSLRLPPGSGPRHMACTPDGKYLFVVNELNSTLSLVLIDQETGGLSLKQSLPTVPASFAGQNFPADIHLDSGGRHVYCSNRGHDSIALFSFDPAGEALQLEQLQPTGGAWPRNFALTPDGRFLLTANQRSDVVCVFRRDTVSGRIAPTGKSVSLPVPVCLCVD